MRDPKILVAFVALSIVLALVLTGPPPNKPGIISVPLAPAVVIPEKPSVSFADVPPEYLSEAKWYSNFSDCYRDYEDENGLGRLDRLFKGDTFRGAGIVSDLSSMGDAVYIAPIDTIKRPINCYFCSIPKGEFLKLNKGDMVYFRGRVHSVNPLGFIVNYKTPGDIEGSIIVIKHTEPLIEKGGHGRTVHSSAD
jgi:hypothetical protein